MDVLTQVSHWTAPGLPAMFEGQDVSFLGILCKGSPTFPDLGIPLPSFFAIAFLSFQLALQTSKNAVPFVLLQMGGPGFAAPSTVIPSNLGGPLGGGLGDLFDLAGGVSNLSGSHVIPKTVSSLHLVGSPEAKDGDVP